ncbi:hypothetical protein [Chitinivibrio alkaliphilus]|uniref:hypothetical protein n=1 Tax=Chitinivibrio alkaliphilus TaxID=1505232 RepID=UPI00041F93D0|nr:hypothetical protein [Chitinivibrio alkaliphilus]
MNTNKHEYTEKVVVSILEHTTQKRAIEIKTKNQSMLIDNLSWLKNPSVSSVSSVLKTEVQSEN